MIWAVAFILFSVSFLYLFVCVDEHGKGVLAKMKIFLYKKMPENLKAIAAKICGQKFVKFLERVAHYICHEANPIVQVMYFFCAFGGFYVYVTEAFPLVPNPYVSAYHKYVGTVIMLLCYASYFAACWTNPGRLSKKTDK